MVMRKTAEHVEAIFETLFSELFSDVNSTIQCMWWKICSPKLTPIEHVWAMLERRIAVNTMSLLTVRDFEVALVAERNGFSQTLIDNLCISLNCSRELHTI